MPRELKTPIFPLGSRPGGSDYKQRADAARGRGRPLEQNYYALEQERNWFKAQNRKLKKEIELLRHDLAAAKAVVEHWRGLTENDST